MAKKTTTRRKPSAPPSEATSQRGTLRDPDPPDRTGSPEPAGGAQEGEQVVLEDPETIGRMEPPDGAEWGDKIRAIKWLDDPVATDAVRLQMIGMPCQMEFDGARHYGHITRVCSDRPLTVDVVLQAQGAAGQEFRSVRLLAADGIYTPDRGSMRDRQVAYAWPGDARTAELWVYIVDRSMDLKPVAR